MGINEIATLADNLPREKTRKAAIFGLVNELAHGHDITEQEKNK